MSAYVTNTDRAIWAENAADVFAKEVFCGRTFGQLLAANDGDMDDSDAACAIGDLIGNLMHLAHQNGIDPMQCVKAGMGHFEAELEEEQAAEDEEDTDDGMSLTHNG